FAPVADVNSNPRNPVIGIRSFGAEPELVARHVAAFVRGLQGTGVAACAKHFPGHGDTELDSHQELPTVGGDLAAALLPFRAIVEAVSTGRRSGERLAEAAARVADVSAAAGPGPGHVPSAGIGLEAARRALRVEGRVQLTRPPLVVELRPEASIAAGPARHGL